MIRPIERKLLKKTILSLLVCFCCTSWTLNRSFLYVNAQSTDHGHQTMTGGRLEWEINTYDSVQDVTIDGTTFRAGGIIILNYYLTNSSTGTIRTYWTGFNSGWYNAANIYTYGATISNVVYSGSTGITFKINNPSDRVTIVISFNGTDMNTSLEGITSFSSVTSLTAATSEASAVQDIDVKLQGVSSTLSQILVLLGSGNVPITEYLSEINAYSAYLEDISISLDDIDNQIDTITWNVINTSYKGWTTDYQSFNTDTYGYHAAGWYVMENPDFSSAVSSGIYKLTIPLGSGTTTINNLKFAQYWEGDFREFSPDSYLYYPTRNYIVLYFTVSETYHQWPQASWPLCIYVDKQLYKYSSYSFKLEYILPEDIEYWTILQAMQNKKLLDSVSQLVVAQDSSSVVDPINDKIDELNDVTQQSQTIENQQIDNLESFNQSIDLDDYDFDFTNRNGIEYFKLKLTNIYDIEEFKPFYLIPIMLFILGVILRG